MTARPRQLQEPGETLAPFLGVSPHMPELAERPGQRQPRFDLSLRRGPVQRRAQVVVFRLEPVEPRRLLRPLQVTFRLLGQAPEEVKVPARRGSPFVRCQLCYS